MSEVWPTDELTERAMAKANRIAALDPLVARMIKRQVNGAQDAMGFRNAVTAGHQDYLIASMGGAFFDRDRPFGSVRRMPGIDRARGRAEGDRGGVGRQGSVRRRRLLGGCAPAARLRRAPPSAGGAPTPPAGS